MSTCNDNNNEEDDNDIERCPECGGIITQDDPHGACLDEALSRSEG